MSRIFLVALSALLVGGSLEASQWGKSKVNGVTWYYFHVWPDGWDDHDWYFEPGEVSIFWVKGGSGAVTVPEKLGGKKVVYFGFDGETVFRGVNKKITSIKFSRYIVDPGSSDNYVEGCPNLKSFSVDPKNRYLTAVNGMILSKDKRYLELIPPVRTSVVVPEGVVGTPGAFSGHKMLRNVTLPKSLLTIRGFRECRELETVDMNGAVTNIDEFAFKNCTRLRTMTIPASVQEIGYDAFLNCTNLERVVFLGGAPHFDGRVSYWNNFYNDWIPEDCADEVFCSDCGDGSGKKPLECKFLIPNCLQDEWWSSSIWDMPNVRWYYKVEPVVVGSGDGTVSGGVIYEEIEDVDGSGPAKFTLVAKPATGRVFKGWYSEYDAEWDDEDKEYYIISSNATLEVELANEDYMPFAVFEKKDIHVRLDANGGTVDVPELTVKYDDPIATAVEALPEPVREGHTFNGWFTEKSKGKRIAVSTRVTKDATYYAHWTVRKYSVAAAVNDKKAGAVSGAGTKAYGGKTTLKAAAKKGYVFVKWVNAGDEGSPWPSALKYRQPSVSFAMCASNLSVRAVFAKASADAAPVLSVGPADDWYVEADPGREISVAANSLSYPAVTLSGAPAGVGLVRVPDTDDRYVLRVTDASKLKPGVYTAKITAKNRAGRSASRSLKIVTPNSSGAVNDGLIAGIERSTLSPYVFEGGMKMKMTLAELGVEVFQTNGWKLASVTGLPTGLSWNGSAIVGAASKTGVFAVTFTMKKTVKDPKTKKTKTYPSTATATFAVDALLSEEVAGTYNGFANTEVVDPGDGGDEWGDEEEYAIYTPVVDGWASAVKVTVTAAGKITVNVGGETLAGSGFDSVSNGVYAVTLRKTQKIKKGYLKGKTKVWEAYIEIDTGAAWCGSQVSGWYSTYTTGLSGMASPAWISAQRNAFGGNAEAQAIAAAAAGKLTFTPKAVGGRDWSYELKPGGNAVAVTTRANGTAVLAGTIAKAKVSGTATFEVSETSATVRFFTSKFIVEVVYTLENGEVVEAFGRVWKR